MTLSSVGHDFIVNQVTVSGVFDTFINVQKRREDIVYLTNSAATNVNLAYIQSEDINSSRNLTIHDRSTSLAANRQVNQFIDQVYESVTGFEIETDRFLVTDIFTDAIGNQDPLPLFYNHQFQYTLGTGESYVDIQLLDQDFDPLVLAESKIEIAGNVYNNLENDYDIETGLYTLYYVTYLVRKADSTLQRYTEILNNQPVYRTATVDDLDSFGSFLSGVKAYIVQETTSDNFQITLPSNQDYAVRRIGDERLRLIEPLDTGPEDPWFVSLNNGQFLSTVQTASGTGSAIYKYRVAEFTVQNFTPFYPYKLTSETSYRVNRRTVKTVKDNLVLDTDYALYPEVFVYDKDSSLRFALTGDPDKAGTATSTTGVSYANVLLGNPKSIGLSVNDSTNPIGGSSIDSKNGFIILPAGYEIDENDIVETTYYYQEDKYELSIFDFNPLSNADALNQKLVVVCKPEPLGSTLTQTIYWFLVDEDGQVIDSNYNEEGIAGTFSDGNDPQTMIANTVSGEQRSLLWYDIDPSTVPWAPAGAVDLVENYTVEGDPNADGLLILGECYVRPKLQPENLVINDIRIRGGGISEEYTTTALEENPEVAWYWDIKQWDGLPYPGAANFFVEVPVQLLEDCGGSFTPEYVQGIANRHTALGIYPTVWKYNTFEPTISGIDVEGQVYTISWTEHDPNTIFDIYTSQLPGGPFTMVASGITASGVSNSYSLTVGDDQTTYILVTGKDGEDGDVCFGGPING